MLTPGGGSDGVHKIILHGCVLPAFLNLIPLYTEQRSVAIGFLRLGYEPFPKT
jgi:hypothetical protein